MNEKTNNEYLALYRDLIVKIIVIKNSQADLLCRYSEIPEYELTVKTDRLQ